jgi:hypothetical protein
MCVEIMEFIRQDVGVRYKVKLLSTESLLHLDEVVAESVFPGDFITLGEVVDSLELVEAFIKVALARASRPKKVPFVRLGEFESVVLEDRSYEFGLALQDFVEHLLVVNVVASLGSVLRTDFRYHLCFVDRAEFLELVHARFAV